MRGSLRRSLMAEAESVSHHFRKRKRKPFSTSCVVAYEGSESDGPRSGENEYRGTCGSAAPGMDWRPKIAGHHDCEATTRANWSPLGWVRLSGLLALRRSAQLG